MYEGSVCVCCMSTDNLSDLFEPLIENNYEKNYAKMLDCCLNVKISQAEGHDSICEKCVSALKDCILFKKCTLQTISILTSVSIEQIIPNIEEINILGLCETTEHKQLLSEQLFEEDNCLYDDLECIEQDNKEDKVCKEKLSSPLVLDKMKSKKRRVVGRPRKYPKDHIPYKIDKNEMTCRECGKEFPNNMILKMHYNSHFGKHVCKVCDKGFMIYSSLQKHLMSHSKGPFTCEKCGQIFNNVNTMNSHKRNKHNGAPPLHRCSVCGERFATLAQRWSHAETVHGATERRYRCGYCDKRFRHSGERAQHVYRNHDIKLVTCPLCDYKSRRRNLRAHLYRRHGIGRGAVCRYCGAAYATRAALAVHVRAHNDDRRFVCKLCGKGFVQKCSLQYHIGSHIRRGDYRGDPASLVTLRTNPDENDTGLLEENLEEQYLDESLLSEDMELELNEGIEEFLLDDEQLYTISKGDMGVDSDD